VPQLIEETNVLSWTDDLDERTTAQAARTAQMPFVKGHLALMPDAHLGLGSTIGSVIPTEGAIMPAAVGVDIGCGMIAVETSLKAGDLPDNLHDLLSRIEKTVPAGVGRGHGSSPAGEAWYREHDNESVAENQLGQRATRQFGTLGSGNHFVEVCLDVDDSVWIVLHSGSRGVGNLLAQRHIAAARADMKRRFIDLPDPDLAYVVEGTPEFAEYIRDLMWAQEYALANREQMMDVVLIEVQAAAGGAVCRERRRINCHHNYTAKEHHQGRNLWITRKGAIRARRGDYGVIPGSMGTNSYIVKGLGNPAAYESSAHGAGRAMSRTKAKKRFDAEGLAALMEGKTWLDQRAEALVDEDPRAYKDIHRVMAQQADLVEIEVELTQILNYKGT